MVEEEEYQNQRAEAQTQQGDVIVDTERSITQSVCWWCSQLASPISHYRWGLSLSPPIGAVQVIYCCVLDTHERNFVFIHCTRRLKKFVCCPHKARLFFSQLLCAPSAKRCTKLNHLDIHVRNPIIARHVKSFDSKLSLALRVSI